MLIAVALLAGIALLAKAADEFVEGAARLAVMLKISPIVVGAVIVGFGTSAPEMIVSGIAAGQGDDDLGIGNIIGSNLANLSLILGAAALIVPLTIDSRVLKKEVPLATGAALLFAVLVQNGLSVRDGVVFFVLLVAALFFLLVGDDGDESIVSEVEELAAGAHTMKAELTRTLVGLVGTVLGAWLLVWGATTLADDLGINDGFVGVTLVALGTSLPELVTAIAAARKKQTDLIIGNLLGSNLFNSLAVGAVVGFLGDGAVVDPSLTGLDLWFMLAVCLIAAVAMFTRSVLEKAEGTLLLGVFIGFLIATWWDETRGVGDAMLEMARSLA